MRLHLVCFSTQRPLQLHGYLTSLFGCWYWPAGDPPHVHVLVKQTDEYRDAYGEVAQEFAGRVAFVNEGNFSDTLQCVLAAVPASDAPFTCFGVDDAVWVRPTPIGAVYDAFRATPGLLGYSLRLGRNIRSNLWAGEVNHPSFVGAGASEYAREAPLVWDVCAGDSRADWGYPWEVVGTVYRSDFVHRLVAALEEANQCNSPSQLEHEGARLWQQQTDCHLLAAAQVSTVVLPVPNRVQQEHGNPLLGGPELPPAFLLDCWQRGLREDTERFGSRVNTQIHVPDFYLRRAS